MTSQKFIDNLRLVADSQGDAERLSNTVWSLLEMEEVARVSAVFASPRQRRRSEWLIYECRFCGVSGRE
ncbi:MAG: hypothetical protein GFH27_549305n154 [Chloroflexi bacterium AL-W]|nr:hypothetical protein [Chloroflexi bacterium AL-N1]NOK69400.1 hypothetical protein [Chloroflexi bacterium AL-N10]NOK76461.1 hypothetical protein [Chloroflexi bacterium AL-N5]NOK83578.1 hypothetical protein [Chloroflexi bacterium AL-W]NOK91238.1 hypothetical protein [Chloroflexi bacterium AL-N15]